MVHQVFVALVCIISSIIVQEAYGAKHVVGGTQGWDDSTNFVSWTSSQEFKVGDQLVFRYTAGVHSVVELASESANKNCDLGSSLDSKNTGNDEVKLTKPGTRYFACGTLGHCGQGMKVKVKVDSGSAPSTPETSPASSTNSTTTSSASTIINNCFAFCVLLGCLYISCFFSTLF